MRQPSDVAFQVGDGALGFGPTGCRPSGKSAGHPPGHESCHLLGQVARDRGRGGVFRRLDRLPAHYRARIELAGCPLRVIS
ncbi:MAG: hypothetical protein KDA83_04805, partial [Planctomycetales bacterium]|nr:hypothetical protein [Planctomycetales bacterium]